MANHICQISWSLARFIPSAGLQLAKHLDPRVTPSVLRHIVVG